MGKFELVGLYDGATEVRLDGKTVGMIAGQNNAISSAAWGIPALTNPQRSEIQRCLNEMLVPKAMVQ